MEGSGGKRNSFCAMYSFRMSFWIVPARRSREMPRFSAAAMYMAQMTAAGEVLVIEVAVPSGGRAPVWAVHGFDGNSGVGHRALIVRLRGVFRSPPDGRQRRAVSRGGHVRRNGL